MKRWRSQSQSGTGQGDTETPAPEEKISEPVKNTSGAPIAEKSAPPGSPDGVPASENTSQAAEKPPVSIKPLDILVPDQIGRYTIGRRIGSGTCGVVHRSHDNLLGREVAVKLSPIGEAHVSTGKVPGAQRAYQTEIIAAGRLTHPNIVTVYDAGQFEDLNFLVMEAVDGKSLKEYGKGKTLLPVGEALRIISACCEALDYSHKQGVLHRDIKPANIMLSSDGAVKLLDYGIAVGLDEGGALEKQGPTLGTPNYMSPEQILGRELTAQSDFYSLATVLFELLTGKQLFKARKVKDLFRTVVHQKAPRLTAIRADLPSGLADVVSRALEKKPKARFQTGREMAKAIEPFLKAFRAIEQRPIALQRLIKLLRQQTFFKTFSDLEVALLLERVKLRHFTTGDYVRQKGDQERRLMIITDGAVKCVRNGKFTSVIGPGECIGETSFINGIAEPRSYSALTSVIALEFSTDDMAQLPPKVHLRYYRYISEILVDRLAMSDSQSVDMNLHMQIEHTGA